MKINIDFITDKSPPCGSFSFGKTNSQPKEKEPHSLTLFIKKINKTYTMKQIIIILILIMNLYNSYSQNNTTYYYQKGTSKNILSKVSNKYTVLFTCKTCNYNINTQIENNSVKLRDWLYVISDTTTITAPHRIFNTYITSNGTEINIADEIVLKFKQSTTQQQINNLETTYNLQLIATSLTSKLYKTSNPIFETANNIYLSNLVAYAHPNFYCKSEELSTIPSDPYFNKQFYLHNTGQIINDGNSGTIDADIDAPEAWDVTKGNSSIKIAVIDDGIDTHQDLPFSNQLILNGSNLLFLSDSTEDPNDPSPNGTEDGHGTACAGIIGAKHNNQGVAGIAPNCSLMPIRINPNGLSSFIATSAFDFAVVNKANVISNSWGFPLEIDPNFDPSIVYAIQNAIDSNITVVFAAGNNAAHVSNLQIDGFVCFPACSLPSSVFAVGASDRDDSISTYSPYNYFKSILSVTAPSSKSRHQIIAGQKNEIWTTDNSYDYGYNPWKSVDTAKTGIPINEYLPSSGQDYKNYTGRFSGTSAAAPQVAAVAGLLLSVNNCLSTTQIKDIIENTADKVGGYNYNYLPNGVSKELGHGRLNANNAVRTAQKSYSNNLDLYIKDCDYDFGGTEIDYVCWTSTDKSPDIWIRNTQANLNNQDDLIHQDPEYNSSNSPVYAYVNVRNKSCATSTGHEKLTLYWSKASTWQSWPQNWDGTIPQWGDTIGSVTLPILKAGEKITIELPWIMPTYLNPGSGNGIPVCLMARVENSSIDTIVVHPAGNYYAESSNNVAMRNMTSVDNITNIAFEHNGQLYPIGREILMGNSTIKQMEFDIKFETINGNLTQDAQIHLFTDAKGFEILSKANRNSEDSISFNSNNNEIIITQNNLMLKNVSIPAETKFSVYVGFNFFTQQDEHNKTYEFRIAQSEVDSTINLGAENFTISRYERTYFVANAGNDKNTIANQNITLNAQPVNESVIYNWYDDSNHFIGQGININITPSITSTYRLDVVSTKDGFMSSDNVNVNVVNGTINNIYPMPIRNTATVNYQLSTNVSNAQIKINNINNTYTQTIPININSDNIIIDFTNYPNGIYTLSLICNSVITDATAISKY